MASVTRRRPVSGIGLADKLEHLKQWLGQLSWLWQSERGLVAALVVVSLAAHAFNMLDYPSFTFKDDEGIYAAQSWAVLREGHLTPYTYFYDHAPAGWLLAAIWMGLTNGLNSLGGAVDSGRLFMLVLHLAMTPLLYRLTRRLGGTPVAATIAVGLFSLSPLAIFYQRMFLLDNIMLFWLLISLNLLLDEAGRLSHRVLSGLAFGLALVTKETAIFLLPALFGLAWQQRRHHQRSFGLGSWTIPMLMVISWYPLYALFKGELLGAGQAFGFFMTSGSGTSSGVSLVDALKWQSGRGGGGLFNLDNLFWQLVRTQWVIRDPVLLVGGSAACVANLLIGWRDRRVLVGALLGILSMFYLARGGIVFDYYILAAIPFLCLNLALLVEQLWQRLPLLKRWPIRTTLALVASLLGFYYLSGALPALYTEHPDQAGREAMGWIKQNLPADSRVVIRDDLWAGLHEAGLQGPAFPNAHSHWKVASDPAIRNGVFHDDWHNVDYLVISPGLKDEAFVSTNNQVALDALAHAHLVKRWESPKGNETLHPQQIIELWKVDNQISTGSLTQSVYPTPLQAIAKVLACNGFC